MTSGLNEKTDGQDHLWKIQKQAKHTHTTERMWKQENTGEKAELPLLGFFTITYFDYTLAGSDKMSIFAEINTSQRQNEHRRRITN